jgi:hypothetical protein
MSQQQIPCFEFISSEWVLDAIEKLQKATISFVMSVCLSVCPYRKTRHPLDGFSRYLIRIFRKYFKRSQVSLKSDKTYRYFTWRPTQRILIITRSFLLRMRNISDRFVEKETHILCSVNFFFENLAVLGVMLNNVVEPDRPQMTAWCLRIACWIPKATDTHS